MIIHGGNVVGWWCPYHCILRYRWGYNIKMDLKI